MLIISELYLLIMNLNSKQSWKVLCWNVKGLNSELSQRVLREEINESQCSIVCLQETKLSECDHRLIKSICPPGFDLLIEAPSRGASGGLLIA